MYSWSVSIHRPSATRHRSLQRCRTSSIVDCRLLSDDRLYINHIAWYKIWHFIYRPLNVTFYMQNKNVCLWSYLRPMLSINQSNPSLFQAWAHRTTVTENNKKCKRKKVKASITSNADIQNVVQCRYYMHRSDVENHLYIYQRDCQIYADSTQLT